MTFEHSDGTNRMGPLGSDPIGYQARVRPDRIACIDPDQNRRLTYRALDAGIVACVAFLRGQANALPGGRIAVLARNGLEQIVIALACQRAGAVFVPLNWRLSVPELGVILNDCEPALLLFGQDFAEEARQASREARLDCIEIESAGLLDPPPEPILVTDSGRTSAVMSEDAPCTLLYTSGTTGTPKGVVITRLGAFFSALNFADVGEISPESVLMSDLPMFHTVGLFAVTRTALTVGATLVVSDRFLAGRTLARLSDPALGVTHYFGVPQIAAVLRDDPGYQSADLGRLKAFFTGGAPLPPSLIEAYLDDGILLVNGYGMSEAGTVLHMPLDRAVTRRAPGCVGLPAPAVEVRIVDDEGRDAAEGSAGEVWLRGPAVTPGYWRKPELTAEAFRDGWFRTGDVARREADGLYRLIDRRKDMYISGGENVYPAEVEAILSRAREIQDVAIIGAPHARWGECGVAFIVLRENVEATEAIIADYCTKHLARYKAPSVFRFVAAIPRTASGKVRKDVLRRLHAELPPDPPRRPGIAATFKAMEQRS